MMMVFDDFEIGKTSSPLSRTVVLFLSPTTLFASTIVATVPLHNENDNDNDNDDYQP